MTQPTRCEPQSLMFALAKLVFDLIDLCVQLHHELVNNELGHEIGPIAATT